LSGARGAGAVTAAAGSTVPAPTSALSAGMRYAVEVRRSVNREGVRSGCAATASAGGARDERGGHLGPVRSFSAYAGPHCSGSGVSYRGHGSSKAANDDDQWTTAIGGYSSNGCSGRYRSIPMSGDNNDAGNYATWSFGTGSITSGTCRVSVHIPASGGIRHVGGNPSYCTVHAGSSSSGTRLASFTINQVDHLGQWLAAPNVRISGGSLSVVLHDRGKDWNSRGSADAHHAADAVCVSCS
jgi:hypothetical protein